jgi:hypothetical protein
MVSRYSRELPRSEIPPELSELVLRLAGRMLVGNAPQHHVLREQLTVAWVDRIVMTGVGLYAYFEHPPNTPTVVPPDLIGGDVPLEVRNLDGSAGSLLKVSAGRLDFVEIYTYGDTPWPDEPQDIVLGEATPLPIPGVAT